MTEKKPCLAQESERCNNKTGLANHTRITHKVDLGVVRTGHALNLSLSLHPTLIDLDPDLPLPGLLHRVISLSRSEGSQPSPKGHASQDRLFCVWAPERVVGEYRCYFSAGQCVELTTLEATSLAVCKSDHIRYVNPLLTNADAARCVRKRKKRRGRGGKEKKKEKEEKEKEGKSDYKSWIYETRLDALLSLSFKSPVGHATSFPTQGKTDSRRRCQPPNPRAPCPFLPAPWPTPCTP